MATCGECLDDIWDKDEWLLLEGQTCTVCGRYRPSTELLSYIEY